VASASDAALARTPERGIEHLIERPVQALGGVPG
jgi:hypothetical protein